MDNGEEIQGLDEGWTFCGAKMMEWIAGLCMFMVCSELFFHPIPRYMPELLAILFGTAMGLAKVRRNFPDEERGIANYVLSNLGFPPPLIPPPAIVQPIWSGAPVRETHKESYYSELKLAEVFSLIQEGRQGGRKNEEELDNY